MRVFKLCIVALISLTIFSCNSNKYGGKKKLTNQLDSISYAIGLDMGLRTKANFNEIDNDFFVQGYISGVDSTNILIHPKELNLILRTYFQEKKRKKDLAKAEESKRKLEKEFGKYKKENEDFLEKNKSLKGIHITDSGLQYLILKAGTGEKPNANSKIKVNFKGSLIDGSVFQSTYIKNVPYTTELNILMKGWIEGIPLMKVGSKYKFFIPQELGYGAKVSSSSKIKPFSTLIFEVELLEIIKK